MRRFSVATVAIIISAVALIGPGKVIAGDAISSFDELFGTASLLESAEMLVVENPPKDLISRRHNMLYSFVKEPKSDTCKAFYQRAIRNSNEFRAKALAAIEEEAKAGGNWFSSLFNNPWNGLKNFAKGDKQLTEIAQRYEQKVRYVKPQNVDCDMNKFQIRRLHPILFVLKTDIKYLLKEPRQIVNKAIFDKLSQDNFISTTNFYDEIELTPGQKHILLDYYASITDTSSTTMGQSINSIINPGEYRIGRLLDSCHAVQTHQAQLTRLEADHDGKCNSYDTDPRAKFFRKQYPFNFFDEIGKFCDDFLDAL